MPTLLIWLIGIAAASIIAYVAGSIILSVIAVLVAYKTLGGNFSKSKFPRLKKINKKKGT